MCSQTKRTEILNYNEAISEQMRTNGKKTGKTGENVPAVPGGSEAVWAQLLTLAENGDIRAIKLYYEMLEKKQQAADTSGRDIEQMAAIRRAAFGDGAMLTAQKMTDTGDGQGER